MLWNSLAEFCVLLTQFKIGGLLLLQFSSLLFLDPQLLLDLFNQIFDVVHAFLLEGLAPLEKLNVSFDRVVQVSDLLLVR